MLQDAVYRGGVLLGAQTVIGVEDEAASWESTRSFVGFASERARERERGRGGGRAVGARLSARKNSVTPVVGWLHTGSALTRGFVEKSLLILFVLFFLPMDHTGNAHSYMFMMLHTVCCISLHCENVVVVPAKSR